MFSAFDNLLFILSKKMVVRWSVFRQIFDALYSEFVSGIEDLPNLTLLRRNTLRTFQALGHIEVVFNADGGFVYVTPPILVRLPQLGLPQFLLCGARSPDTVANLLEAGKKAKSIIDVEAGSNFSFGPKRIVLKFETLASAQKLANDLQIGFQADPAAWGLANYSGSLMEYLDSRVWTDEPDLNWARMDFNPASLYFEYLVFEDKRLSRYQDPVRTIYKHFFWNGGRRAEVDLDWGRYAALHYAGVNLLSYDSREQSLSVPLSAPLPSLLSRALGLCYGKPPVIVNKQLGSIDTLHPLDCMKFESVPMDIAKLVAQKVGQEIQVENALSVLADEE